MAERHLRIENFLNDRPNDARHWHELGTVCEKLGDIEAAGTAWQTAVSVLGTDLALLHDIGRCAAHAGLLPDMLTQWSDAAAVAISPGDAVRLPRSVILATLQDQLAMTLPSLESAYRNAWPGDTELVNLIYAHRALGNASRACCLEATRYLREGDAGEAVRLFEQADQTDRLCSAFSSTYLDALRQLDDRSALRTAALQMVANGSTDDIFAWLAALIEDGETRFACELLGAVEPLPENRALRLACKFLQPAVPTAHAEVLTHQRAFDLWIEELETFSSGANEPESARLLELLPNTFYYGYQVTEAELSLSRYGRAMTRLSRTAMGSTVALAARARPEVQRIRVGYVTSFACFHTVARYFAGWLQHADLSQFEVHLFPLNSEADWMIEFLGQHVAHVHSRVSDLNAAAHQIQDQSLDVLVYPEVGMDRLVLRLAAMRLSPVQCVAWGHPLTTGLDTIDYFLSTASMEPDDGHRHYAERLVMLPGIGACVPAARVDGLSKARGDFGLAASDIIYLTPQSLFKYRPQDDLVFPRLVSQVENSVLVFVEGTYPAWTRALDARLRACFAASGVAFDSRVRWVPRQDYDAFLRLLEVSDVFLDCPHWSGGMTTLDAIACRLPVVTLPGLTMRSRQSASMLRQLGIEDTIASDLDSYIEIATKLGQDAAWRGRLAATMGANQHRLFDDVSCVRALEAFFRWAAGRGSDRDLALFKLGPAKS